MSIEIHCYKEYNDKKKKSVQVCMQYLWMIKFEFFYIFFTDYFEVKKFWLAYIQIWSVIYL